VFNASLHHWLSKKRRRREKERGFGSLNKREKTKKKQIDAAV